MPSLLDRFLRRPVDSSLPGPIVIGGVGGSGTRLLAQALQDLDVYIGDSLNRALDNLWYTLLLRREELFPGLGPETDRQGERALRLFHTAMTRGLNEAPTRGQRHLIQRALTDSLPVSKDQPRKARKTLLASLPPDRDRYRAWGWKEPNTHIHLERLAATFPDMKYILLMRHGLDMAFSGNRVQLNRWGKFFDVSVPECESEIPVAALRYWIRANQRALELGRDLLGDRFLPLSYDELCCDPEVQMNRFLDFVGLDMDAEARMRLLAIPRPPDSMGRYLREDCSRFGSEELEAVQALGFRIEGLSRISNPE